MFISYMIFLLFVVYSHAGRRITDGDDIKADHNFMVYLLKAPASPMKYDAWICGGAIVSPLYIVTSAACVEDVQHMYAVAGYKKYVPYEMINQDDCGREMKKKVIFICVPKNYNLTYEKLETWSLIDIAVVKVETPYQLGHNAYPGVCSYAPEAIVINYEDKFQRPGLDAVVFGWGHASTWRSPNDAENYNQEILKYAPVLIQNKTECKKYYEQYEQMDTIIDKYMICTMYPGNLDDAGDIIQETTNLLEGCVTRMQRLSGKRGPLCLEVDKYLIFDPTRRSNNRTQEYRRYGNCQNDHGGPLVTWVGARKVLIGVASVFRVNDQSQCEGPYLYTSTHCNGAFLKCILDMNRRTGTGSTMCDIPDDERGFDIIERTVSWFGHPDGPAENEKALWKGNPVGPTTKDEELLSSELFETIFLYNTKNTSLS